MEQKTAIKTKKIFLLIIFFTNFIFSQTKNYYTIEKNGKKYPKIVRHISLDKGEKIIHNSNTIIFNIDHQIFKYNKNIHKADTCSNSKIKKIKVITVSQLTTDEYNEHLIRSKENGRKIPVPFNHYNCRVFILEKLSTEKNIIYEVDWIYSIR